MKTESHGVITQKLPFIIIMNSLAFVFDFIFEFDQVFDCIDQAQVEIMIVMNFESE